jgi:cellulose synthase/poly-beta-1,6-N-acetylglucosamine synthase-like glycosyltransferase
VNWGHIGDWILVGCVLTGALPLSVNALQFLLIGARRRRNHYDQCGYEVPRTVVLVPAWNEAAVIGTSIDRLLTLDYPTDRLKVVVVDDASTDDTPEVIRGRAALHPGRVVHLRREKGGQGKAHTLNHGIDWLLRDDWMQAMLIMDADVIYERDALRKMVSHLADPKVGAVTAYIKEGSSDPNYLTRFIAHEYLMSQAMSRRAQAVMGAMACLAGGAQLHSRANLEALGGRIDTTSLAEDTFTTFNTQLGGRQVIFEGNAIVWAEEPGALRALWKQRLRWGRGNVAVTFAYKHVWFRPSRVHRLGGILFGLSWWCVFALPIFMIVSSGALVGLYFVDFARSWQIFRDLWIINALCFVFVVVFAWTVDPSTAKRSWPQALLFPGIVSFVIILVSCFPRPGYWVAHRILDLIGVHTGPWVHIGFLLAYIWVAACMAVAYLAKVIEAGRIGRFKLGRWVSPALIYIAGFGSFLCAVTVGAYIKEIRRAESKWDKTEKTGRVSAG